MEIKKLKTATLSDALTGMRIGETAIAPEGYTPESVRRACSELKAARGLIFSTSTRTGVQTITRLK